MANSFADSTIDSYFDDLLLSCVGSGAHVIHIEPSSACTRIRIRVDFSLEEYEVLTQDEGKRLVSFLAEYEKQYKEASGESQNAIVLYPTIFGDFHLDIVSLIAEDGNMSLTVHVFPDENQEARNIS